MQNPLANTVETSNIVPMSAWKATEAKGRPQPAATVTKLTQAPDTTQETLYPTETFRYKGREYTIYKRSNVATASWNFRIERDGKPFRTSLETSALETAVAKAKQYIDAADQRKLGEVKELLTGRKKVEVKQACAVEKYLTLYEETPNGENTWKSRHAAVLAFRRIAGDELPERMDQLAPMFKAARDRANVQIENAASNTEKMTIKRSFNSELANASSIVAEKTVYYLKDKLTLPDFSELRVQVKFLRFADAKKTAAEYNPPKQEVLDETLKGWMDLPRNEFLAVGLALCCGMRRGEIRDFADWSWFESHGAYLWCNGRQGDFKDRTDVLRTQVLEPFYSMMMERVKREEWSTKGPIITGNRSEFDRNISDWMKSLGWKTRLHLHSLRAWAGSLVFMKYGIPAARKFCRHTQEETTERSYGWMKEDWHTEETPVLVGGKPVEWARGTK